MARVAWSWSTSLWIPVPKPRWRCSKEEGGIVAVFFFQRNSWWVQDYDDDDEDDDDGDDDDDDDDVSLFVKQNAGSPVKTILLPLAWFQKSIVVIQTYATTYSNTHLCCKSLPFRIKILGTWFVVRWPHLKCQRRFPLEWARFPWWFSRWFSML